MADCFYFHIGVITVGNPQKFPLSLTAGALYVPFGALLNHFPDSPLVDQPMTLTLGETREEWKFYGKKGGWVLKTFLKKRNLFFIGIYKGYFRITFVFGEKAFKEIMDSDLSAELKSELEGARKYAEGRGLGIQIDAPAYMEDIKKLIRIKIEN